MIRRVLLLTCGTAAFLVAAAGPALATVGGTITCTGSADITPKKQANSATGTLAPTKIYTIKSSDSLVKLPRSGVASWRGSVSPVTHNHHGEVSVGIGPLKVRVGSWGPSRNDLNLGAKSGVKSYDIPSWVPPFEVKVTGFHKGDEGRCDGSVTVDLLGGIFSSAAGIGIAAGTVVTGALTLLSGLGRKVG